MLGDILKRVDAIVADHSGIEGPERARLMALPDAWVLEPTNLSMGDVRALVARVRECEATVADERRAELVRVATAIYAPHFYSISEEDAVERAGWLISACESQIAGDPYADDDADDNGVPER